MTQKQIIVAGGGLGGLGAALGLAKKGKKVVVLEKASELGEIGAGIQLGPNAFHSFDYLGVGKGAREQAVYIEHLRFMDAITAEEVNRVPLDEKFRTRFGNPYAVVHRADLHKELVKACEDHDLIELRVNSEVVGYDQDGGSESLRWNAATLWMGPNCHLVHYPLSGWKVFNLVITKCNDAKEVVAGKPLTHAEVHANFEHIHDIPRQLIDIGQNWKVWVLCDRVPTENWVDGRAVLLGDAAHPTLQYYAQGACMALEDAVCLSEVIGSYPDNLDEGLKVYTDNRVVRTARIQIGSRQLGDNWFHVDGVHRKLRNEIMGKMTAEDYYYQLQWLYGHKASELAA